jgi:rhodanese-related sulfurtransferase
MVVTNFKFSALALMLSAFFFCAVPALAQTGSSESGATVGTIETAELSKLVLQRWSLVDKLEAEGKAPPAPEFVLVDVRSPREMSVSVIPGAISKADFEKNIDKYRGSTVIPYCMVGGRCADFSRRLAQEGWTVRSYKGSIIDWVQNELPLVTPLGQRTSRLHTNGKQFELPADYRQVSN